MSISRGVSRDQIMIPMSLDEMISENNPVRLIDTFIDGLDLKKMGFSTAKARKTGRPPYVTKDMLGLYIYGYLNSIRATRKLERECYRNVEVMWLLHNIKPDHSSIASFRHDNAKVLKKVFRQFTSLCIKWELVDGNLLVVDGTKVRADNNKKNNYSEDKLTQKIKYIDEKIDNYFNQLEKSENDEPIDISELTKRKDKYTGLLKELKESGERQISTTDEDSRLMDNKQGSASMCYNEQATVDSKNHIVIDFKVTNNATDQGELSKMGRRAKRILRLKKLEIMADKGYYSGKDLSKCKSNNITAIVSRQDAPRKNGETGYTADDFKYDEEKNCYICPMEKELPCISSENTKKPVYSNKEACKACPNVDKCTKDKRGFKRISHSEYHDIQKEADELFKLNKKRFKLRQQIVEHVFGTVKYYLGYPKVNVRTKVRVEGEFALLFLSYNFTRAINILGFDGLMARLKEASSIFFVLWQRKPPIYGKLRMSA